MAGRKKPSTDNMTAPVSCFAGAYHCRNSNLPVFADPVAEQMLTAESIGMRFACEYPDKINEKTHVSVITRAERLNELTENMISLAEDKLMAEDMDDYRTGAAAERR